MKKSECNSDFARELFELAQSRSRKPNRQQRKARRLERERKERAELRNERNERDAERERERIFADACRTTAGPKRQGKGRRIMQTTDARIAYERGQGRMLSLSERERRMRERLDYERKVDEFINRIMR